MSTVLRTVVSLGTHVILATVRGRDSPHNPVGIASGSYCLCSTGDDVCEMRRVISQSTYKAVAHLICPNTCLENQSHILVQEHASTKAVVPLVPNTIR
jgi:hypothetical protein